MAKSDAAFSRRIAEPGRIIPAAPDARLCHVHLWYGPGPEVVWMRVLAWNAPLKTDEPVIPLTVSGWLDWRAKDGVFLVEEGGRLYLLDDASHSTSFATADDVVKAIWAGELHPNTEFDPTRHPKGDPIIRPLTPGLMVVKFAFVKGEQECL